MEVNMFYKEFTNRSAAASEMVRFLETLLNLVNILKNILLVNILLIGKEIGKVICKLYRA